MFDIDGTPNYKAKSVSTENSQNLNITWAQNGYVISPMNTIKEERWPFKLSDETEEEFKARMERLKKTWQDAHAMMISE